MSPNTTVIVTKKGSPSLSIIVNALDNNSEIFEDVNLHSLVIKVRRS